MFRKMTQTRTLLLEDGENLESALFRVQKGWIIRFCLGTTLQPLDIKVFCNYPENNDPFDREHYNELSWVNPTECISDTGDRYASIEVYRAGNYHFFATDGDIKGSRRCVGYFIVEPSLRGGSVEYSVDQIVLQTVLTKCLGPFNEWKGRLQVAKEANYNLIHFTPIQTLGESYSSYSIKDHLSIDPRYNVNGKSVTLNSVRDLIKSLQNDWNVLSITDMVWNHTANNSDWLLLHPDSAYNLVNSPHLRPAFLLDRCLWHFSKEVMNGVWESHGIPTTITSDAHLEKIAEVLRKFIMTRVKLEEFFILDIKILVRKFCDMLVRQKIYSKDLKQNGDIPNMQVIQDKSYRRHACTVDLDLAVQHFGVKRHASTEKEFLDRACDDFQSTLLRLNSERIQMIHDCMDAIVYSTVGHIRYHFIDINGPRKGKVSLLSPLVTRYFTCPWEEKNLEEDEKMMNTEKACCVFAHNGWVIGGDALKDFAAPDSLVYLKRELVAWGDSIKLRYGNKPSDSPFLWEYMKKYSQDMASIFHGFRIDNCHGTPIPVGEYLLDAAREVNPDLYVLAELFTNSEAVDNIFMNKLGIASLIRERMAAHDSHTLGSFVHRYGGVPVGSFISTSVFPMKPMMAHALFMDLSHDNRSVIEARSPFDFIAGSALVAISSCAIGSNRGYDEMVPEHIHVVTEDRKYQSFNAGTIGPGTTNLNMGILRAKKKLNALHVKLAKEGYSQIYVDQVNKDVVSVTRHCPATHESYILVAHTAFTMPSKEDRPILSPTYKYNENIPPLVIPGILDEIVLEAKLLEDPNAPAYVRNEHYINGLQNFVLEMQENISISESVICEGCMETSDAKEAGKSYEVHFVNFPPGSIVLFKVSQKPAVKKALGVLRSTLALFPAQGYCLPGSPKDHRGGNIDQIVQRLSLVDLNYALYRCNNEEVDDENGGGVYVVPNIGPLAYCGLQGFMSVLWKLTLNNDLGHPLCDNLRQGDWMVDYIANRLQLYKGTKELGQWLEFVFAYLKELPRYLIPCYFEAIVRALYRRLIEHSYAHLSEFVQYGSSFVKALALGSIQMCGFTRSARLAPLSPNLKQKFQEPSIPHWRSMLTMAGGLPHFSFGIMRCWGRDTFISLKGLLLITGRFAVARNIILGFAGCLRHGLIPNLLGSGVAARYNCRDAVWWWLEGIQNFTAMAPNGHEILADPVARIYPTDDSEPVLKGAKEQPLYEVIQEALQRHIDGISFRERNAGKAIDDVMSKEGFHQTAGVSLETGFVYGGNKWNCGTWMDKMGASEAAGNYGHPATPRDGSAVEIVGLCKSAVRWLHTMHESGFYPYKGVIIRKKDTTKERTLLFSEWSDLIQKNFEKNFWISPEPSVLTDSKLIHRRGIYKDSVGSSNQYTDFQLRPNFPIAMSVAPELFDPQHAWIALQKVEDILLGPLGLATLDVRDMAYNGFYDNQNKTATFNTAEGFNYHQGPEWVWILGPFLWAKLYFANRVGGKEEFLKASRRVNEILAKHREEITSSVWHGLPELTNANGAFCSQGCPTQAWSMGCLLEVMHDMENMMKLLKE